MQLATKVRREDSPTNRIAKKATMSSKTRFPTGAVLTWIFAKYLR